MEEYMKIFEEYLNGKRDYTKTMFKITSSLYRGVANNRFTFDEGLSALEKLYKK